MKQLAYGGTFDPIHYGHLTCARAVAHARGFDRVVLIPASRSPLKPTKPASGSDTPGQPDAASPEDRLAMCRLAAARSGLFEVDDLELHRPGPSYTLDTIRELQNRGWDEVSWLIGADQVAQLPLWHKPLQVLREATLLIMARPGWAFDFSSLPEPELRALKDNVVPAPLVDISATEIRRRVAAGEPIDGLTPPDVVRYIRARGLYRA